MVRSLTRSRVARDFAVSSTLALAVSLSVGASGAKAQAFLATPTVVAGSANVTTGTNTTTVTVSSPSTVINWTPNDNAINPNVGIGFQNSGTTATFTNNPASVAATTGFAVLNNILPADATRAVQFDGTVISQLQSLSGASTTSGTVYFFSPAGILVGPNAVFNVGNLGLSASPITYNATTGAFGATGSVIQDGTQTVSFGQANAGSSIQISGGAQINANSSDGSYVAIVAPQIYNSGAINVSGNAALVAADAATITFNPSGLYSISIDAGTSATGTPLYNNGTITGSAATSAAIAHQIYLMTAPKNSLLFMTIGQGSNLGFDVAGAANVSGNSIILSGGYDVANGAVDPSLAPKGGTGGSVNLTVDNANITSALTVISSNNAQVDASSGVTSNLASNASVFGYKTAFFGAYANSTLIANGTVRVRAIDSGSSTAPGTSQVTGGTAQIFSNGGTVALHGSINTVAAFATGATSQTSGVAAGNATGGNAQVLASSGGTITADGGLFVSAPGQGGSSATNGVAGGNGLGGIVFIQATGTNSSVIVKGNVGLNAQGQGGTGVCTSVCAAEAGTGTGGSVNVLAASGGSISLQDPNATNTFTVNANGSGGRALNTNAGAGSGGSLSFSVQAGSTLSLASAVTASASGYGGAEDGTNLSGGLGTGGNVSANVQLGGTLTANGSFSIAAEGYGGSGNGGSVGSGSSGGAGKGGSANISSNGGTASFFGTTTVSADAYGGSAGAPGTTGNGGTGTGGNASISANLSGTTGGTVALKGATYLNSTGYGSSGYVGGLGTGGTISFNAAASSSITADNVVNATARGFGGGNLATGGGAGGGNGKGGSIFLTGSGANANLTFNSSFNLISEGYGGSGNCVTTCVAEAGSGTGGVVQVLVNSGGALSALDPNGTNSLSISADGYGGGASHTNAGDGSGGSVLWFVQSGSSANLASALRASSSGFGGGEDGTNLLGGKGTGGTVQANIQVGGTLNATGLLRFIANGAGGAGDPDSVGTGSSGGTGQGGNVSISSIGGSANFTGPVQLFANASGGYAGAPATTGNGGAGTGGNATITAGISGTTVGTVSLSGLTELTASGSGGAGYQGGLGTGGSTSLNAQAGGSITAFGEIDARAEGDGGTNQTTGIGGGNGKGGNTTISASGTNANVTLKSNVNLIAEGYGGVGLCASACTAEGGTGTGGFGQIFAGSGGTVTAMDPNGTNLVYLSATGFGAKATHSNAGDGKGGSVSISAATSGALNLVSKVIAGAQGNGGEEFGSGLTGGNATGGSANVNFQTGGTLTAGTAGATFSLSADAIAGGGNISRAGTGISGGNATGGNAVISGAGNGTFNGALTVSARGFGGAAGAPGTTGKGGSGTGGNATINSNRTTAGVAGTITLNGATTVSATGQGGTGYPGGLGMGGSAQVFVRNGNIAGNNIQMDSSGFGGAGALNGSGGMGIGGSTFINARNNTFGASTVLFANVDAISNGQGGRGGDAPSTSLVGGTGGDGVGGSVLTTADAGDGRFTVTGRMMARADAFGGDGGNGANNDAGRGGMGGAGGNALATYTDPATTNVFGGNAQIGSVSGAAGTTANGQSNFGSLYISSSGDGGNGGLGGNVLSSGTQGNGGAGGNAADGFLVLLVRGTPVTISGTVDLVGNATGGNGGAGATAGNGGNAVVGGNGALGITVTNRFQVPTQRATLTAGDIAATAAAVGGTGATNGSSLIDSGSINFNVTNSDVTTTSLNMLSSAGAVATNALPSQIQASGGTLNLGSQFQFASSGPITVALDTATLNTGVIGLSGSDWVLPTTLPTLAGTINATAGATFTSGNNIVTYANANFGYPVNFSVIGDFQLGNVTVQGDFSSFSGGKTTLGTISATNIDIAAGKAISAGAISTPGFVSLDNTIGALSTAGIGDITFASVTAGRDLGVFSNGSIATTGTIQTGANVAIQALGGVTVGSVSAGLVNPSTISGDTYEIAISSGGPLVTGNLASQTDIGLLSASNISTGTISGRDLLLLDSTGFASGAITASNRVLIANASMAPLGGQFGGHFDPNLVFNAAPISSAGAINLNGPVTAGSFSAYTQQGFTSGSIATTVGTIQIGAGTALTAGDLSAQDYIALHSDGTTTIGNITRSTLVDLTGIGATQTGAVTSSGEVFIYTVDTIQTGALTAGTDIFLESRSTIATGAQVATTSLDVIADGGFTGSTLTAGGALSLVSSGIVTTGNLTGASIAASGGSSLTAGNLVSNSGNIALSSTGTLTVGSASAAGTLSLTAPGKITAAILGGASLVAVGNVAISGGDILIQQGNQVFSSKSSVNITSTGSLNAGTISAQVGTSITTTGNISAGNINGNTGAVTLQAGGSIQMAQSNAVGIAINAGTTFGSGNLFSSKALSITTGGNLATAFLTANGGSAVVRSGGTLNAGVINTTSGIVVNATGVATVQGLTSSGAIQFNSGSTFTSTGNIVSANQVIGGSTGTMTLANVTASGGVVELASSRGNLTTGRVSAATDVAVIAGGSLSLGQVAGRDIVLLASTDVQSGAISAGIVTSATTGQITGANGRVLIANASVGNAGGSFGSYNFNAVFNAGGGTVLSNRPPRIGGTVNVTGTVNAQRFASYSQGAMTGQVVNGFGSTEVESGGLVTVGQRWTSPDLTIYSNDIAILPAQTGVTGTTTAGISSGTTGTVALVSINPNGAFIGDGLTAGQGYALSNAETALVQSGSLTIGAVVSSNLATTMTIGTLALTGPQAGSNVDNQQSGAVQFITGTPQTQVVSGTIRVTGAVTAKGFLSANQLQFQTGAFELDNTAGSLTVTGSAGAQAGGISIAADRIHIAAASILDKLRADPLYTTRITDLNTAPTQPPAGAVLSASQLIFKPTQTLYIQNTGNSAVQAGFLVPLAGLTITTPTTTTAGQSTSAVSLVINGQFVGTSTSGGTTGASITGTTAYTQFLQATKLTGITTDSTFNGCSISAGVCGMTTATPSLSSQITVLAAPALPAAPPVVQAAQQQQSPEITAEPQSSGPGPGPGESQQQSQSGEKKTEAQQKEEKEAKASAKAPIAPPAPMIDTRPLSPSVSVDEPVAGGGNPALFGIGGAPTPSEGGVK